MKLAYADLYRYNADPRFAKVPVQGLSVQEYARSARRSSIRNKANCNPGPEAGHERHRLSCGRRQRRQYRVADSKQLLRLRFRHRGAGWVSRCRIAEGCSCSIPTIPTCCSRASVRFTRSFPRSWSRATRTLDLASWAAKTSLLAHAQFVSNVVDYGMNVQAALEAPRFTVADNRSVATFRSSRGSSPKSCRDCAIKDTSSPCARNTLTANGTRTGRHAQFEDRPELGSVRPQG